MVVVVELVDTPGCDPGGVSQTPCGFKSRLTTPKNEVTSYGTGRNIFG
jgi:hypothetical protein